MPKRLAIALLLFVPVAASALTAEEIQAQIQALLAQIAVLEAQLQTGNTTGTTTNIGILDYCPSLTRNLVRGSRDSTTQGEVTELQKFLAGYFNLNPVDIVTGYFGVTTESRVKQLQAEKGLPHVGIVGPLTRAAIKAACGGKSPTTLPMDEPCTFDGQRVAHRTSVTAYERPSVGHGNFCTSESRACVNGTLYGSYLNSSCYVRDREDTACTFGNQAIEHGATVLAYEAASVAAGGACRSQIRTCDNGSLSGSYTHALCSVAAAVSTYSQGSYYSQGTYYSQGSYYSQASYSGGTSISVSSPASGSALQRGSTITISWQSQNAPAGAVMWIEFRQNPRFWDPTVVTNSGPASGSISFTVPSVSHATSYNQLYFSLKNPNDMLHPYAEVAVPISVQ